MTTSLQATRPADTLPPAAEQRGSGRDPWFDNAKMVLVTLVVIGHSWVLLPEDSLARNWLYDFLYLWHMPAFVLVTGYLSRSFSWSRRSLSRLVTVVAVPYLVFEALMAAFRVRVGGEEGLERLFLQPHWPMWFLAALFLWRLLTPALRALPWSLPLAVVVSLLGGLLAGDILDVGRVTGMLPFFVLGLVARPEHVEALRGPTGRRVGAALLAMAFCVAPLLDGRMRTEWLYWRSGYDAMGVSFLEGAGARLGLLAVSTVLALAALALVPRRATWFTALGPATMVVYLFHGFFVRGAEYTGLLGWASDRPWAGLLTATVASAVLAVVLAVPPVARRLEPLVDPVGALRRRHSRTGGGGPAPQAAVVAPAQQDRRPVSFLPL